MKTIEKDNGLHWNVDDYDGTAPYMQEAIPTPMELSGDRGVEFYQYQRPRDELIELEIWQGENGFGHP